MSTLLHIGIATIAIIFIVGLYFDARIVQQRNRAELESLMNTVDSEDDDEQ